ncbi:hypothetical protein NPS29_00400 [Pseudomonas putida]|uniref:hypothetical protein n=1 Tax=Pseudomonas putida TaxID=303 RepID=UPI00236435BD|nr:hypothetical protein [Pseudomonas putida]MDD1963771.1 hypothetical protein [Pseudomonas putida]
MSGYVHLEKYYQTLNVSFDRLNFGAQKYAIYGGGVGIVSWIGAFMVGIAAALLIAVMLALLERPGKAPAPQSMPSWMARIADRARELRTSLKITAGFFSLAILLVGSWYLTMQFPSGVARNAALNTAAKCSERTLIYKNLDRTQACQIAESDDVLFLLKRSHADKGGVSYHTLEVPKEGLLRIETQEEELRFDS